MFKIITGVLALLLSCGGTLALAAMEEGAQLAPEPTVNVGWVYFFGFVFVGICVWFGYAIWRADKKSSGDSTQNPES